jgi:hypothetical protein
MGLGYHFDPGQPRPYGTTPTAYEQVRKHPTTLRVSLSDSVANACGGIVNLPQPFTPCSR